LIEELRRILAQARAELAYLFRGRTTLAQKSLELRQAIARERADILTVVRNNLVDEIGCLRQIIGHGPQTLYGYLNIRASSINYTTQTAGRHSDLRSRTVQLAQ
jgi:hypothetical protein